MYSPEKSQVEICLLKSNLEEIENTVLVQRSSLPKLDAENERKFRESLNAVKTSRALSVEVEKINQENARLVAKRMHLTIQSAELAKALEKAREDFIAMEEYSNSIKQEIELLTRKYEDTLRENSDRFRETRAFFNGAEMNRELEQVHGQMSELERVAASRRQQAEALKRELEALSPELPDNLLNIIGKKELDEKVTTLSKKCETLHEKRNDLMKTMNK